jgi:tetratricopeptide (TPR) repeat protein
MKFHDRLARGFSAGHRPSVQELIFRFQGPQRLYTEAKRYTKRQRWELAEILFDWSARLWAESLGPTHMFVGSARAYEGWCLLHQGQWSQAIEKYQTALSIAIEQVGHEGERSVQLASDLDWVRRRDGSRNEVGSMPGRPDRPSTRELWSN